LTIDSRASESSAVEPVASATPNFPTQIALPATSESQPARTRAGSLAPGCAAEAMGASLGLILGACPPIGPPVDAVRRL
jgi:hypothetical protein